MLSLESRGSLSYDGGLTFDEEGNCRMNTNRTRRHSIESYPNLVKQSVISAAVLVIAYPAFADSQIDLGRGPITIHVPALYDPGTPTPLAILLHGYASNGSATEAFFGFATAAETAGIIYAAPTGATGCAICGSRP